MKRVALISPAPRYYRPLAFERGPLARLRRLPRLSLLALEAVTPRDWSLELIDERVDTFDPDRIDADLVGITTMTYMAPRSFEIARALKARGKTVVLGGYFPTLSPDLALAEPAVDAVVIGRAERSWPRLLLDYEQGTLRRTYDLPFGEDSFSLPAVDHRLLGPERGFNGWLTQVQANMGCKFRCRFCVIPGFHKDRVSMRKLDDLVEEVAQAPTRRVLFVDDNLLNRPAYLEALCDRLRPLGKEWIAQVSMDIGKQRRLLKKMAQSGCGWLNVGIESVNAATLADQRKWQNDVTHYLEALHRIRDEGINISAGMVLGFPDEPRDVFDLTGEFLDRAPIDITVFHLYCPYPGTPEHTRYAAEGRLLTHDLELYDTYHVVVRPKNFSPEEVAEGFERLQERFYGPRRVVRRAFDSLVQNGVHGLMRTLATGAEGLVNLREGIPLHP